MGNYNEQSKGTASKSNQMESIDILDKEITMCNLPQWLTAAENPWPLWQGHQAVCNGQTFCLAWSPTKIGEISLARDLTLRVSVKV